jgi:RNA polymerase sigma factor (sigma-70 family)
MRLNTIKRTDNMLTTEQQTLAEEHYNFALKRAHSFNKSLTWKQPTEDVISAALFGLTKAAESFDPSKAKFMTWAARIIDNELCMLLRKRRWPVMEPREDDIAGSAFFDTSCPEVEAFISYLPAQERRILQLRMDGLLQKEIGAELGITQSYISRVLIAIGEEYLEWRNME